MRGTTGLLALAATVSSATAAFQGFNYGSTFTTGAAKVQSDFENEFNAAQGLAGTNGAFNSGRLYTMVVSFCSTSSGNSSGRFCPRLMTNDATPTARRHLQLPNLGYPGCHQNQDEPTPWSLGFCG